ncbi:alpha/beta hydrolase fold domain-containing protein [Hymenobacter taeanensis]|uniref:Alpha/beta hydrolase fold domain-containing protein n=1 Tax=Hymenobacter taeanensis TaxID=2735321 RepID=A0A6M6BE96_9BACT|nr:alpha/beta hydrolase fold domain-containing protein [Hymenobacter taeanensis]QJX46262.1 alpha/beta hydrolase fold domain-containing protein [Hymenobacter taeanensis]
MKHLFTLLLFLSIAVLTEAQTRIDTTGGRYYKPLFSNVTRSTLAYGAAVNYLGNTESLSLDLYQPDGDTVRRRPLLIFAHGGGFVSGNRSDQDVTELCNRFAKMGYVTASIDYRIVFLPFDTINLGRAAIRAAQDMRAAVRFFRKDAAASKSYRIHSDFIYVGGTSAGAVTALETAYLDKDAEVPTYIGLAGLGGLEGSSGNPGYSSKVRGAINLSGALGSPTWIEAGDVPFVSLHGTNDAVLPYAGGKVGSLLPPLKVYGSAPLHTRALAVGVQNPFYTFKGAGHVPFSGTTAAQVAYMDTTVRFVRDFLRPLLRQPSIVTASKASTSPPLLQAYPIPATSAVRLTWPTGAALRPAAVELLDATGRVVRRLQWEQPELRIARENLRAGTYFLRAEGVGARRVVFE